MAAGRAGNFGDGGGARRGRNSAQGERGGVGGGLRSEEDGAVGAGRGGAVDLYGSERGTRDGARRSVFGYFAQAGGIREEEIAEHVPPVQGAGGRGHHKGADGSGADVPLYDGRDSRGGGDGAELAAGTVCGGGSGRGGGWGRPPGGGVCRRSGCGLAEGGTRRGRG